MKFQTCCRWFVPSWDRSSSLIPSAADLRIHKVTMKKESDYSKKLRDPRWQKKRLEVLQRDQFACRICQAQDKELHIHHRRYSNGDCPWDSPTDDLVTVCTDCHDRITRVVNRVRLGCSWDPYLDSVELLDDLFASGDWQAAYACLSGIHKYFIHSDDREG